MDVDLEKYHPDDWIEALPRAQAETVRTLAAAGKSHDEIALRWLSGFGAENTFPFGASGSAGNYLDRVKAEVQKLICGHPDYEDIRAKFIELLEGKKEAALMALSGFIGSQLGLAAAAILPVVALVIAGATQIGVQAWCAREGASGEQA